MSGQQVTYKSEKVAGKMVYFEGTDTVHSGYAFCYNVDATPTATDPIPSAYRVEKPSATNLDHFAGVLDPAYAGRTGPCYLRVLEPDKIQKVYVHTDQNCTLDVTTLYLAPGTYALTSPAAGGVKYVGKALETVNRSGTAGPVLAVLQFIGNLDIPESFVTRGPSSAIWASAPYAEIKANPMLGTVFEDDFKTYATSGLWTLDNTNGTGAQVAADDGGMVYEDGLVNIAMTGADNDAAMIVGGAQTDGAGEFSVDTTALGGRKIWFEARFAVSQVADGDLAVGLCDPEVTDVNLIENDDTQIEENFIGFRVIHGDPDGLDAVISEAGAEAVQVNEAKVLVADTPVKVGFVYDPDTDICTWYVDGVSVGTTAAAGANAAWPHSVDLSPVFCIKAQGATSTMTIDWIRVLQLGE